MRRSDGAGGGEGRTQGGLRPHVPALLSGVLLAAALPPFPSSPLPFVALVPLAWGLAASHATPSNARAALRSGYVAGAVFFLLLLHWVAFSIPGHVLLGVASLAAATATLALFPALAIWATHSAVRSVGIPLWIALPTTWTAGEWLRGHLPLGLAFPWAPLALGLVDFPRALALAPRSGELGVTFWIVLVNGLVAEALVAAGRSATGEVGRQSPDGSRAAKPAHSTPHARGALRARTLIPAGAAAIVACAPLLLPAQPAAEAGTALEVALVETAVGAEARLAPDRALAETRAAVDRALGTMPPGPVDLVVLPETSFLVELESAAARETLEWARRRSARARAPLLLGALGSGPLASAAAAATGRGDAAPGEVAAGPGGVFNSMFLIDSSGPRARYDKQRPVPGAERLPIVAGAWVEALADSAFYAPGRAAANGPLPLRPGRGGGAPEVTIAVAICWESAFSGLVRAQVARGARVIVNPTNDAWFGGVLAGAGRAQHEAHLVLRAVETGVTAVRAANGGAALSISPEGRVSRRPERGEGVLLARVPAGEVPTAFVRAGDRVGPASVLACLLILALLAGARAVERPSPRV